MRTLGRPPTVATGTPTDDKGVAQVVEIDTDRLDPYFLAAFLRADVAALPVANTLGAVSREDLRRCRIPRMPLAEQHRYGTEFRRLAELQAALQLLADLSGKVIEQAIHGLTAGACAGADNDRSRNGCGRRGDERAVTSGPNHQRMAADIWAVADLLRGDYKRHEYGQVILPFTVLRRLDAVMAPTRAAVWARDAALNIQNKEKLLERAADLSFFNVSKQNFTTIAADTTNVLIVAKNLRDYVNGFSPNVREVLDRFDFNNEITRLTEAKLIHLVVARFKDFRDLDKLSNHDMGYVFEHLIRKFAEDSNETAGEHFTPREVIELMVNLLIAPDEETITGAAPVINVLDPACGTGGMLTTAGDRIKAINPGAEVYLFGQELNRSRGQCASRRCCCAISAAKSSSATPLATTGSAAGGSSTCWPTRRSAWSGRRLRTRSRLRPSVDTRDGSAPGLPRINDGSFLFLQHMISKMNPVTDKGSRLAIVFNGSPLFTGAAGSGESEIRRWILENDWLEGIVALPDQLLLQHRHLHVLLDPVQQEGTRAAGQGHPARRPGPVGEDAQVPRRQAQADQRSTRSSTSPSCTRTRLRSRQTKVIRTTGR